MKLRFKKIKGIFLFPALCLWAAIFCLWQNNGIVITKSEYGSARIPREFDGYVIAQISDLHNKEFGEDQKILLNKLKSVSPNIIVVTGDLIDRRKFDLAAAMAFIEGALRIAPVYYVPGNHEAWSGRYPEIKSSLLNAGVQVLDDETARLTIGAASISISGVKDPAFLTSGYRQGTDTSQLENCLRRWSQSGEFRILLSHRPELFDLYAKYPVDLIFSGHAHGGQIRLPFIGGLAAPGQGLFPRYTSGLYTKNSSAMFVSRGLGNSIFPIRVFNRPEIVAVTLNSLEAEENETPEEG